VERLEAADTAFASVNDMAALSAHPHLRRIEVETPSGMAAIPAPAPIVSGQPRSYGAVPALGQHADRSNLEASR
jgi:itaconate CoA-transferase